MTIVPLVNVPIYSEVGQVNNLRWVFLYKEGENFLVQSGKVKCKDFFNDVVSAYRGVRFSIYGFDTNKMKFNEEGVYIQLTDLQYAKQLWQNIGSINNKAVSQGMPPVEIVSEEHQIILIPRAYFSNTYYISLLTYCIRISHTNFVGSYKELVDGSKNPARAVDCPFAEYAPQIFSGAFQLPVDSLEGYPFLLYPKKEENEASKLPGAIHNNGVHNWWWYAQRYNFVNERAPA